MKKLVIRVCDHAQRHVELLQENRAQTEWSEAQAQQIIGRIEAVLVQLPEAQRQAEERILNDRQVPQEQKILSLYDAEAKVIKRGKAGASVEFGNVLVLGEQRDGLLIDWHLEEDTRSDSVLTLESVERVARRGIKLRSLCGDRGFSSQANEEALEARSITSYLMLRSTPELRKRMKRKTDRAQHHRRAQTEGRVGIFQHQFMGVRPQGKGLVCRRRTVSWGILAHNLWKVGRRLREEELAREAAAAAALFFIGRLKGRRGLCHFRENHQKNPAKKKCGCENVKSHRAASLSPHSAKIGKAAIA